MTSRRVAVVRVSMFEMQKLVHGIVLPDGYSLASQMPGLDNNSLSYTFIVESPDLPYCDEAAVPPQLGTIPDYQGIVVERWRG